MKNALIYDASTFDGSTIEELAVFWGTKLVDRYDDFDEAVTAFDMTFAGFNDYIDESLTLTSSGDSFFGTYCDAHCIGYAAEEEGSNQIGGTWSKVSSAPEIDPASLASGLTLLLGGLLVLRGRLSRQPGRGPVDAQSH